MRGSIVDTTNADLRRRLRFSWSPDCPVDIGGLRLVEIPYVAMDGAEKVGEMVLHADVTEAVLDAFSAIHAARFPIERMELIDQYEGDDNRSMAANNTSAFNCRIIPGTDQLSQHSFGLAVDLNPALNPYMFDATTILPTGSDRYLDRTLDVPGLIAPDGPAVRAFADIGWKWGGAWDGLKDYHHFSATGG
ncbi:MAG: M15 family metallopeptidase [Acidimicrobiia bacterium]|nr:M15 family metallopeptidase [Acidimicrobiia bacterium]